MQNTNDVLSNAQRDLLIPAFNLIVEILEKEGIKATVAWTDDSRTVSFAGKHGKECEYHCWISPMERPRVYRNFGRSAVDHGFHGIDYSGQFVDEVKPEVVVKDFEGIFRFYI